MPGEDRRPAGARAGGDVQRGLADRAADRLARETAPRRCCPTPCAMKSRFGSDREPAGVRRRLRHAGALDEHDHGDGRAPRRSDRAIESSDSCGRCGVGMPLGILPESSTRTRLLAPSVEQCRDRQRYQRGDRGDPRASSSTIISTSADTPTAAAVSDISPGCVTTFQALARARSARLEVPGEVGDLAER